MKTAADTAGSASEVPEAKKVAKYALREPGSYDFTPLVVESYMVANVMPRMHS